MARALLGGGGGGWGSYSRNAPQGHSKHEMWMRLCDMCAKHPEEIAGVLKVSEGRKGSYRSRDCSISIISGIFCREFAKAREASTRTS